VKVAILPKAIYIFSAIPIKILRTFIKEIEKSILKSSFVNTKDQIAKTILSKKNNTGGITIPKVKL
jgi:hypothetical protein